MYIQHVDAVFHLHHRAMFMLNPAPPLTSCSLFASYDGVGVADVAEYDYAMFWQIVVR